MPPRNELRSSRSKSCMQLRASTISPTHAAMPSRSQAIFFVESSKAGAALLSCALCSFNTSASGDRRLPAVATLPGSTAARRKVVETALHYYDSLGKQAGDNRDLLEEIARGYDRLGDVLGNPYQPNLADRAGATPDPFNRNLGKNLSPFDLPQQFRLTAQYEVPVLRSSLPVLKNKVVAYALSGWGTGWSLSYQSAPLVGLPTSAGTVPISNFLGYGPGPAQLIPSTAIALTRPRPRCSTRPHGPTFPTGSSRRIKARFAHSGASAYLRRTPTSAATSVLKNATA